VVSENEVLPGGYAHPPEGVVISKLRFEIGLNYPLAVYVDRPVANLDVVARGGYDSLYEGFAGIPRVPEDHDIAPVDVGKSVNEAIYEYSLLIDEPWLHARPLDLYRLDHENDDENCRGKGEEDVPKPGFQLVEGLRPRSRRGVRIVSVPAFLRGGYLFFHL